jgi:hypothetical protein
MATDNRMPLLGVEPILPPPNSDSWNPRAAILILVVTIAIAIAITIVLLGKLDNNPLTPFLELCSPRL